MILASTPCVADDAGHLLTVFLLAAVIPYSSGCSNLHTPMAILGQLTALCQPARFAASRSAPGRYGSEGSEA